MHTKAQKKMKYVGLLMAASLIFTALPTMETQAFDGYVKAATYTSDAWVSNFWNTESDHMDEELAQIHADGFNSIILVIPWREFQPDTVPISYNSYAFSKLDRVMDSAGNHGLGVVIRLGYTWDYYADEASSQRFRELLREPRIQEAWMDYARKVYQAASAHGNFRGGFMTWEDMWNYVEDATNFGDGQRSKTEAEQIGFHDYLRKHYSVKELNKIYNPTEDFAKYEDVYIPSRSQAAYRLFFEFYDDWLNETLTTTQKVFPGLSMEVRLDWDVISGGSDDGSDLSFTHESTYACGNADFTSTMYSVSMGQAQGAQLGAGQAVDGMTKKLAYLREHNDGKPVFIDQLLYMDETEGFENNARLQPSQRGAFLTGITGALSAHTNGYGIWTYRNYGNNPVYNCQFALGSKGWDVSGGSVAEHDGSRMMRLGEGGSVSQKIGHRIGGRTTHDNHVRFTADSDEPVTVTVTMGLESREVTVEGRKDYDLNFGELSYYSVEFTSDGIVWLDNIQVYNFVQDGQLYDIDGSALSCIGSMRALNAAMP